MKTEIIGLALIALAITPPASAAEWREVSEWQIVSADKGGTDWYMRLDDIAESHGGEHRTWVRLDHRRDPHVSWRESKILYNVNCPNRTYAMLQETRIRADGGTTTTTAGGYQHGQWSTFYSVPGSMMEMVVHSVCDFEPLPPDAILDGE